MAYSASKILNPGPDIQVEQRARVQSAADLKVATSTEPPTVEELREARPVTLTHAQRAMIEIDDLEKEISKEIEGEEIANRIVGIGDLYYTKLKDYKKAAETYSRVPQEYPDEAEFVEIAFGNMISSYQKLNDREMVEITYLEIKDFYPKGNHMHEDAVASLAEL